MEETKRQSVHFDDELCIVGDVYYYRGTPEGSKKRREFSLGIKVGAAQRDVLKAKKDKLEGKQNKGSNAGRNGFKEISDLYVEDRKEEAKDPTLLSASSLYETKNLITKHFQPYAGNIRIEDIDQLWFNDYCIARRKKGYNLVNHRKVINHFLKWCVTHKYIKMRPELGIPKRAKKDRRQRIVPTDDEYLKIISEAAGNLLLYLVCYSTLGMRNGEILKLKRAECDMLERTIWIDGKNNRTRKSRQINMNDFVYRILAARFKHDDHAYVFPNQRRHKGKTPHAQSMHKVFSAHLKRIGVNEDITPHDMRAFFETHMHVNPNFSDSQREKMVGAEIDVQKQIYVKMQAKHIKGLENSVNVKGLTEVLNRKISEIAGGKSGGKQRKSKPSKHVSVQKKRGKKK